MCVSVFVCTLQALYNTWAVDYGSSLTKFLKLHTSVVVLWSRLITPVWKGSPPFLSKCAEPWPLPIFFPFFKGQQTSDITPGCISEILGLGVHPAWKSYWELHLHILMLQSCTLVWWTPRQNKAHHKAAKVYKKVPSLILVPQATWIKATVGGGGLISVVSTTTHFLHALNRF